MEIHLYGSVYTAASLFALGTGSYLAYVGFTTTKTTSPRAGGMLLAAGAIEATLVLGDVLVHSLVRPLLGDDIQLTVLDVAVPLSTVLHGIALVLVGLAAHALARGTARRSVLPAHPSARE